MKALTQEQEDTLLAYLDGTLSPSAMRMLEQELDHHTALRTRLEELRKVHEALQLAGMEEPSGNFTQAVMSKLDHYPARAGFAIHRGILLLLGVLIATGIASYMLSGGVFDNATTPLDLGTIDLPRVDKPLPSILLDGKLMVNIIILLNLVIAWCVLDRTILKPYFKRRLSVKH